MKKFLIVIWVLFLVVLVGCEVGKRATKKLPKGIDPEGQIYRMADLVLQGRIVNVSPAAVPVGKPLYEAAHRWRVLIRIKRVIKGEYAEKHISTRVSNLEKDLGPASRNLYGEKYIFFFLYDPPYYKLLGIR